MSFPLFQQQDITVTQEEKPTERTEDQHQPESPVTDQWKTTKGRKDKSAKNNRKRISWSSRVGELLLVKLMTCIPVKQVTP